MVRQAADLILMVGVGVVLIVATIVVFLAQIGVII